MNLNETKPLWTTGGKAPNSGTKSIDDDELLGSRQATKYRAAVARCNYLSGDRPDIQFGTKELARGMSKPSARDWEKMVHMARYLVGNGHAEQWFERQDKPTAITCFTDSDWAGCRRTRKSSSGGGLRLGCHTVKTWARTQATIATSSGEAELYAAVKGASEMLGVQSLARDFGRDLGAELRVDAKATIGMVHRSGLGKLRHVEAGHLWIQQAVRTKRITVKKVLGTENVADLMTKYLDTKTIAKHMECMRFKVRHGRCT